MKQRIRINESQLNQIVAESVERALYEANFTNNSKGTYNRMRQRINEDGNQMQNSNQMQNDDYAWRANTNERNSSDLTKYAMEAYKTLVNGIRGNQQNISYYAREAAKYLMDGLRTAGFGGYADGSGTDWRNDFKASYNKHQGYDGSVEPSSHW